ncbi:MAG TPA: carboxymuconolactone decarboxylase family protein [Kofleriaceae bacterium]|nr:carboxymuconolactone decarboxylase family protein [Kofleriaceae bacterium]
MTTNLDQLKERLPDYARDLRINLGVLTSSTALTPAQAWTIALTSAVRTGQRDLIAAIEGDGQLAPEADFRARAAAAIMGMNNVYYRFLHFMGEASEYGHMPARLRMQVIGNPGPKTEGAGFTPATEADKLDFELACLAASAITGCESCVRSHEKAVREKGGSKEMVQDAVRIAAVVNAIAIALPSS